MQSVTIAGEDYVVLTPEPTYTLVLTRRQFIEGLQRGKHWRRRQVQADREAKAAPIAEAKRSRLAQD